MGKVSAALGAYILFFYLLSRVNVFICLYLRRNGSDDHIAVEVRMLGRLLVYRMKVPVIEFTGKGQDMSWLVSEVGAGHEKTKTHPGREQRFVKNVLRMLIRNPRRLRRIVRVFRQYMKAYRGYMNIIYRAVTCEIFEWETKVGSEDAAVTAVTMGMFHAIKHTIVTGIYRRIPFATQPSISVKPVFGSNMFETELKCIFRIRLGHVINATTRFVAINRKEAVNRV